MIRLFAALALPEDCRDRLSMLQSGVPGARWVDPDNLHLTLRFHGEVETDVAEDIHAALARLRVPGFDLRLDGVGSFGTPKRTDSLWVGVSPNPALVFLRDKVERAAVAAGLPAETRKFHPHVTLGRLRQATSERVARWLAENGGFQWGPIPVEGFSLFRSQLGSGGSVYDALADYPLGGPGGHAPVDDLDDAGEPWVDDPACDDLPWGAARVAS